MLSCCHVVVDMKMGSQQASKFIFVRVVVVGAQIFLHIETIFDNEKIKNERKYQIPLQC